MNTQNYDDFYKKCDHVLNEQYPSTKGFSTSKMPLSPFVINLNQDIKIAIQKTVHMFYKMVHLKSYKDKVQKQYKEFKNTTVPYHSLLMSYDFHVHSPDNLKLIEVNTNSSGYLLSDIAYRVHGESTSALSLLKESFFQEWFDFSGKTHLQSLLLLWMSKSNNKRCMLNF